MSLHAYHPGTQASVLVETTDQLNHMRASGWMLHSEYEANQAAAAEAAAAAEKAAKPAAKKEN